MVSIIGDGAAWIRNLTAAGSPEATCIVDLYHPREPLHSLTRSPEFMRAGPQGRVARRPAWRTSTTATSTGSPPTPATARPQPGSEPNPDARIADGSVTDTARRGDLL
jgi:hypothetical protein